MREWTKSFDYFTWKSIYFIAGIIYSVKTWFSQRGDFALLVFVTSETQKKRRKRSRIEKMARLLPSSLYCFSNIIGLYSWITGRVITPLDFFRFDNGVRLIRPGLLIATLMAQLKLESPTFLRLVDLLHQWNSIARNSSMASRKITWIFKREIYETRIFF